MKRECCRIVYFHAHNLTTCNYTESIEQHEIAEQPNLLARCFSRSEHCACCVFQGAEYSLKILLLSLEQISDENRHPPNKIVSTHPQINCLHMHKAQHGFQSGIFRKLIKGLTKSLVTSKCSSQKAYRKYSTNSRLSA